MKYTTLFTLLFLPLLGFAKPTKEIMKELNETFKNTPVSDVRESPIDGLYEVHTGTNVIYFHPESKLLVFGEIYTRDGVSLTAQSRNLLQVSKLALLKSKAIPIGKQNAKNQIIEFTSPECSSCKKVHAFFSAANFDTSRYLIFDTPVTDKSRQEIEHLICEPDIAKRTADYELIMKDDAPAFKSCSEAADVIAKHAELRKMMRVQGTPVLFINSTRVEGVNFELIRKLLL